MQIYLGTKVLPYKKRKLKALGEVEHHVTMALAKMNKFSGMYIGDLRELKDLVGIKLKLEQIQRRVSAGHRQEQRRNERSST